MGAIKRSLSFLMAVLLLTVLITPNLAQADSGEWEQVSPNPTASTIEGVAYGDGQFVAVGYNMGILSSTDGYKWKLSSVPINDMFRLMGVSYGNGRFVVVGSNGLILTLEDGQTEWKVRQQNITVANLRSVAFGNGSFVAVGANGQALTSTDGITWTGKTVGSSDKFHMSVTYGGGKFIGIGNGGFVIQSEDGNTWSTRTIDSNAMFNGITYGNNKYVAVGQSGLIMTSLDGNDWVTMISNTNVTLNKVTYDTVNNLYVVVGGEGTIVTSTNGVNWEVQGTVNPKDLNGVGAGNGSLVAVGYNGAILTSNDGLLWKDQIKGTTASLLGIDYGHGMYVAVGYDNSGSGNTEGAILSSLDGETWVNQNVLTNKSDFLKSIRFINNKFIILADREGGDYRFNGVLLTSSDGLAWSEQVIDETALDIVYGNSQYVIVTTSGKILISLDGESWSTHTTGVTQMLYSVTYGNGLYVISTAGYILTSTNGVTWNKHTAPSGLYKVTYGNGIFVGVGMGGAIFTSQDGQTWTSRNSTVYTKLDQVKYDQQGFMAVGEAGVIVTSKDGITWTKQESPVNSTLRDIASNGNEIVAVGQEGVILRSLGTNVTINPKTASFDKYSSSLDYKDVVTTVDLNGNNLTGISNGNDVLVQGTDYTFLNGIVTLNKDYLKKQPVGTMELSLAFSKGTPIKFVITISDSRPPSVTVNYLPGDHGTIDGTSEQVEMGGHPIAVPIVTPMKGYHFAGWSSDGGVTKLTSHQVANLTVTANVTYTAYYTPFVMGDADGDGKVTASDALLLTKYIKGKVTLTPQQLQALDMNGDGKWDDEDIKIILAISVGKG
jgi:photosystem II stability/assembly factor-like uncharacterized protein